MQFLFPEQEAAQVARTDHLKKGAAGFGKRHKPESKPIDLEVIDKFRIQYNFYFLAKKTAGILQKNLQNKLLINDIVVDRDLIIGFTVQKQTPGSVEVRIKIGMGYSCIWKFVFSPVQKIMVRNMDLVENLL